MAKSLLSSSTPAKELRNFTDREPQRETLRRMLERRKLPLPVIMFYGVGGIGKSWLLKQVRNELVAALPSLPMALIDLDSRTGGTVLHQDFVRVLAECRRQFDAVNCPGFDLAYAWLRYKEHNADEPLLRGHGAAADAFEIVKDVIGSAAGVAGVGYGVEKLGDYLRKRVIRGSRLEQWFAEKTGQEDFCRLRDQDIDDIRGDLQRRLLEDLSKNLPAQPDGVCRAILFIDTFEGLTLSPQSGAARFERESWVRDLHCIESPVLLVLAGRDRLTWGENDPIYASEDELEQHLVGGLSAADARAFLTKCDIGGRTLQDAILRNSIDSETVTDESGCGYHPFSLGLCADAVFANRAAGRAADSSTFDLPGSSVRDLARRFLESLPDQSYVAWVRKLSLTPRFDEPAGREAFSAVAGAVQDAAWDRLLDFSFVQGVEPGWYTLNGRMRTALASDANTRSHHAYWRDYWRGVSKEETDVAASLAWYHTWCIDSHDGASQWETCAIRARNEMRMRDHSTLIEWWAPTDVSRRDPRSMQEAESFFRQGKEYFYATVGDRNYNVSRAIERFDSASRFATEHESPELWGRLQLWLGTAFWHFREKGKTRGVVVAKAFQYFDNALRTLTCSDYPRHWATTYDSMGSAYWYADGDELANLSSAVACFEKALSVFTHTAFPIEWAQANNNLGVTYRKLAERLDYTPEVLEAIALHRCSPSVHPAPRALFSNLRLAIECYEKSLTILTEASYPRDWATTMDNLGTVHRMRLDEEWIASLHRSIDCYTQALRVRTESAMPKENADTHWNLGLAQAELFALTGDSVLLNSAIASFENSERAYIEARMPDCAKAVREQADKTRTAYSQ